MGYKRTAPLLVLAVVLVAANSIIIGIAAVDIDHPVREFTAGTTIALSGPSAAAAGIPTTTGWSAHYTWQIFKYSDIAGGDGNHLGTEVTSNFDLGASATAQNLAGNAYWESSTTAGSDATPQYYVVKLSIYPQKSGTDVAGCLGTFYVAIKINALDCAQVTIKKDNTPTTVFCETDIAKLRYTGDLLNGVGHEITLAWYLNQVDAGHLLYQQSAGVHDEVTLSAWNSIKVGGALGGNAVPKVDGPNFVILTANGWTVCTKAIDIAEVPRPTIS